MAGCTAMPVETLEAFTRWLQPGASVFVALPQGEYEALRRSWELP
jgi:hypothetical protein